MCIYLLLTFMGDGGGRWFTSHLKKTAGSPCGWLISCWGGRFYSIPGLKKTNKNNCFCGEKRINTKLAYQVFQTLNQTPRDQNYHLKTMDTNRYCWWSPSVCYHGNTAPFFGSWQPTVMPWNLMELPEKTKGTRRKTLSPKNYISPVFREPEIFAWWHPSHPGPGLRLHLSKGQKVTEIKR